jgi:hypothetical protein
MSTVYDVEVQALRNGKPFTRPTWLIGGAIPGGSGDEGFLPGTVRSFALVPGAASDGEKVIVSLYHGGNAYFLSDVGHGIIVHATLSVEGLVLPTGVRSGILLMRDPQNGDVYDGWTCAMGFPHIAIAGPAAGVWDLLLRGLIRRDI